MPTPIQFANKVRPALTRFRSKVRQMPKREEAIAKALEQNGQVALAMAIIDKLPEISASYAQAVASIDQLTVFDGAAGVSGQTNEGLAQSLAFIKDATGIDVAELVNKRADGTTTLNRPVPVEENK